jgi:hypothetical protein
MVVTASVKQRQAHSLAVSILITASIPILGATFPPLLLLLLFRSVPDQRSIPNATNWFSANCNGVSTSPIPSVQCPSNTQPSPSFPQLPALQPSRPRIRYLCRLLFPPIHRVSSTPFTPLCVTRGVWPALACSYKTFELPISPPSHPLLLIFFVCSSSR